jgi:hypothetical protein
VGGQGTVFRGQEKDTGKFVAVKEVYDIEVKGDAVKEEISIMNSFEPGNNVLTLLRHVYDEDQLLHFLVFDVARGSLTKVIK